MFSFSNGFNRKDSAHETLISHYESNTDESTSTSNGAGRPSILEYTWNNRPNWSRGLARSLCIFLVFIGVFIAGRFTATSTQTLTGVGSIHSCSCGGSVSEALSRGCKFDAISVSLLPPHCIDEELLREFNEVAGENPDGTWNYWKEPEGKNRLNDTEMLELADSRKPFFASHRWHIVHCVYMWKKSFRLQQTGIVLEHRFYDIRHISHCGKMFTLDVSLDKIKTVSWVSLNSDVSAFGDEKKGNSTY